jgi:large subunit ribosomal protein L32
MPNPKRRHSKSRSRKRRAHDALTPAASSDCPNCGAPRQSHRVCPSCGFYNGRVVIAKKAEANS